MSRGLGDVYKRQPINTFHNSGNSSNLYFRSTAPNGVIRLSPFTEMELPEWATVIERNLYIVNNRPYCPTLFCLNMTGPPGILIRIKMLIIIKTGNKKIKPKSDAPRSKRDLINIQSCKIILKTYKQIELHEG